MRLLVIEDYRPLRDSLLRGLRDAGYAVDATGGGEEGLWYAETTSYDVIVLDLMLPGMDGLTLLRRIRTKGHPAQVLILTAKDELDDRIAGLDSGGDDYLPKPFAFAELEARVRALTRRRYAQTTPTIRIADMEINTVTKQVSRDGTRINLTAREYELLELLARRRGEVVSRTEIWEGLYEFDDEVMSNVVDVYIGYLRKKLESGGRPRLIRTRRGLGYQLGESC